MTRKGRKTLIKKVNTVFDTQVAEMTAKTDRSSDGLANRALLDKMDKLRELGISDMVPLPQVGYPIIPWVVWTCD